MDLLTFHRPTYFTTGFSSEAQVKFQFSIKYDLWPNRTEAGDRSRGWNRVYAAEHFMCGSKASGFISWGIRVWLPFGLADNPDISEFVGFGEASLRAGMPGQKYGRFELSVAGRKGTTTRGSLLFEGKWLPPYDPSGFWRFTPYAYTQLFAGYGETLLGYDRNRVRFRVGVGFTD